MLLRWLPAIVSEGLVGFRHTMRVFALLHRGTTPLDRIEYLAGQPQIHALLADAIERAIDDVLGHRLLAALHDDIDEPRQHFAAELGVRQDTALGCFSSTCHTITPLLVLGLGTFRAVFGATLSAICDTGGVETAAHRVVAHAGQVLDAAAADQHHRMLLKDMPFTP